MTHRRWSRAQKYRLLAVLNTLYPYKMILYVIMLIFGGGSLITDFTGHPSWDFFHVPLKQYVLLGVCMTVLPIVSITAGFIRGCRISLYLSITADLSTAFALLAYTLLVWDAFGLIFGVAFLLGVAVGMLTYGLSDVFLLRMIATQPRSGEMDAESRDRLRGQRVVDRLHQYVGPSKWQQLIQAADAVEVMKSLDPHYFDRDKHARPD